MSTEKCLLIEPNHLFPTCNINNYIPYETLQMHWDTAELAAGMGFNVFVSECLPKTALGASLKEGVYPFGGSADSSFDHYLFSMLAGSNIRHVERRPLNKRNLGALTLPFVVAAPQYDGGSHKYAVDTDEQLQILSEFTKKYPKIAQTLEVRPFVETPSDTYTSYRLVFSAASKLLAAGLLFSKVIKGHEPRMSGSGYDTPELDELGSLLASRNICSNANLGGTILPLMGSGRISIDKNTETILKEHTIDPHNIEVPGDLARLGMQVAEIIGKRAGIVFGLDFLQERTTGDFLFLEANRGPDAGTYATCWPAPGTENHQVERRRAMLSAALKSIAVTVAGDRRRLL